MSDELCHQTEAAGFHPQNKYLCISRVLPNPQLGLSRFPGTSENPTSLITFPRVSPQPLSARSQHSIAGNRMAANFQVTTQEKTYTYSKGSKELKCYFYLFLELMWQTQGSQKGRTMVGCGLSTMFLVTSHSILQDFGDFITRICTTVW